MAYNPPKKIFEAATDTQVEDLKRMMDPARPSAAMVEDAVIGRAKIPMPGFLSRQEAEYIYRSFTELGHVWQAPAKGPARFENNGKDLPTHRQAHRIREDLARLHGGHGWPPWRIEDFFIKKVKKPDFRGLSRKDMTRVFMAITYELKSRN